MSASSISDDRVFFFGEDELAYRDAPQTISDFAAGFSTGLAKGVADSDALEHPEPVGSFFRNSNLVSLSLFPGVHAALFYELHQSLGLNSDQQQALFQRCLECIGQKNVIDNQLAYVQCCANAYNLFLHDLHRPQSRPNQIHFGFSSKLARYLCALAMGEQRTTLVETSMALSGSLLRLNSLMTDGTFRLYETLKEMNMDIRWK